jgi:hypothetical protein
LFSSFSPFAKNLCNKGEQKAIFRKYENSGKTYEKPTLNSFNDLRRGKSGVFFEKSTKICGLIKTQVETYFFGSHF